MKIRSITAIPIRATRAQPMLSAAGAILGVSDFGIIRIQTDEGIEGIGEISMNGGRSGALQCNDVNKVIAPTLIDQDPLQVQGLIGRMERALEGSEAARSGVEMALLDIVGKALGVPVSQLLGGKVRDSVPVCWVLGYGPPEAGAEAAAAYTAKGFPTIKIKVGRPGTGLDTTIIAAVRQAVGDHINIKVDANAAYTSPMQAVQEIARMEEYGLQLVEQPVPGHQLENMAFIRSRINTPLLADESMWRWQDAYAIARAGAADVLNIYVSESGGLLAAAKAFAIGEAAGLPALIGSQCELGIGTAAAAHLGVCMPNLAYESDVVGHLRYPVDIVNETLSYEGGQLRPPDGPGLGVTVNERVLAKWRLDI